jgi:hypothetical protein
MIQQYKLDRAGWSSSHIRLLMCSGIVAWGPNTKSNWSAQARNWLPADYGQLSAY